MENSQTTILLINNTLSTWYGPKKPYHVIVTVWVKATTYTTFVIQLINNTLQHGMPIPCNPYHEYIERGMGSLIYIRDPYHTTFYTWFTSTHSMMRVLKFFLTALIAVAVAAAVMIFATGEDPSKWSCLQITVGLIKVVFYFFMFKYFTKQS